MQFVKIILILSDIKTFIKNKVQNKGENYTVVALNWGTLGASSCPYYDNVYTIVPKMGSMLADILNKAFNGCLSKVRMIGHSLGMKRVITKPQIE